MFNRGIRLPFTLLGIPVILDWSFLIILPLLAWIIGNRVLLFAEYFGTPQARELATGWTPYLLGLIAAIGLFVGVILHELGHAVTARAYGVKVRSITLWFLGGVARFEEIPRRPGAEAVIAIVGPLVSLALAGLCWLVLQAVPRDAFATGFVMGYLAYMNIVIAVFNMIPALPLDGGRVLRSLLALKLPYLRATQIAGAIAKGLAIVLGLFGLLSLNFFLLLIALFIFMAVTAETSTAQAEEMLRGLLARDLMNPAVRTVPPDITVADLHQRMLHERHLWFPVVDQDGRVLGIVRAQDTEGHSPAEPVSRIMERDVPTVREDAEAVDAFRRMVQTDFAPIMVTDRQGRLVGLISRADLMHFLQIRSITPEPAAMHERPVPWRWQPA